MLSRFDRAWAEIRLDHIAHNVREIRRITSRRSEIMAIVKADAYGHGVMETVRTLLENGIGRLGVSMLDEAIQLRKSGISVPILVLGHTDPRRAEEIVSYGVTQTIFHIELAEALSSEGVRQNRNVGVHVKIDTGMSRVGFMPGYEAVKEIIRIGKLPRIRVEGLFTHFATADEEDSTRLDLQFEMFMGIWHELNRVGLYIPEKHCANSAALLRYPRTHLDIVRPGIALYGLYPWGDPGSLATAGDEKSLPVCLRPAMQLKCSIVMVKEVETGSRVSYGGIFKTSRPTRIATIPIGYADGYTRLLTNRAKVLVQGQLAPVIGRICMDQCMVDITDVRGNVSAGDEVVLMGCQGTAEISANRLAEMIGTIHYEVVSVIGRRVPRVYLSGDTVVNVVKYLL